MKRLRRSKSTVHAKITLPTKTPVENEIMESWKGDASKPLVSILCITYNHVDYIEDAIKSFLTQKTDFPYEILIHDDASTDGTTRIIDFYSKRYPNIIKVIYQEKNQYSRGSTPFKFFFEKGLADYCAICEGDDFWICASKLQKQFDTLSGSATYDIVVHRAYKIDKNISVISVIGEKASKVFTPASEIISRGGGWCATSSIFLRKEIIKQYIDLDLSTMVSDVFIQCLGAVRGGGIYLDEIMSVYRTGVRGSWSERNSNTKALIENDREMQRAYGKLGGLNYFSTHKTDILRLRARAKLNTSLGLLASGNIRFLFFLFSAISLSPKAVLKRLFSAIIYRNTKTN